MASDLARALKTERIQSLKYRPPLFVSKGTTLRNVLAEMSKVRGGCVLVEEKGKVIGIFTERDALMRTPDRNFDLTTRIEEVMTPNPICLKETDSVADAIRSMSQGGCRHVPIMDAKGKVIGIFSARAMIRYLAEHFPYEVYNLPPNLHQSQRAREGA